jgi:hypothetical protein
MEPDFYQLYKNLPVPELVRPSMMTVFNINATIRNRTLLVAAFFVLVAMFNA